MLSKMLTKLENPQRRKELSPGETLRKAGFAAGMTLCDIGAGTGLFLFEAARISREAVFALEIDPELIQFMLLTIRLMPEGVYPSCSAALEKLPLSIIFKRT